MSQNLKTPTPSDAAIAIEELYRRAKQALDGKALIEAEQLFEKVFKVYQSLNRQPTADEQFHVAQSLNQLAILARAQGKYDIARKRYQESADFYEQGATRAATEGRYKLAERARQRSKDVRQLATLPEEPPPPRQQKTVKPGGQSTPRSNASSSWDIIYKHAEDLQTQIESAVSQGKYDLAQHLLEDCAKTLLAAANKLELEDTDHIGSVELRARGKIVKERLYPELATLNKVKPPPKEAEIVTLRGREDSKLCGGYGLRLINHILEVKEDYLGRENAYDLGRLPNNQWVRLKNLMGEQLPVYLRRNGVVLEAVVSSPHPPLNASVLELGVCDYSRELQFQMQPNCRYVHPQGTFSIIPSSQDREPYKNIRHIACASGQENTEVMLYGLPTGKWTPLQLLTGKVFSFPLKVYISDFVNQVSAREIWGKWIPLENSGQIEPSAEADEIANRDRVVRAGLLAAGVAGLGVLANWLINKSKDKDT